MTIDADDFGSNHIISDMCQSHDCRKELDILHYTNPKFKVTLFAIPGEMTRELLDWCEANKSWVELAVHGFYHTSNYECEKLTYEEFDALVGKFQGLLNGYFVKGFKAPGWQISDGAYKWLADNGWWVADQGYNDGRRPRKLPAYVNHNGNFVARPKGNTGGFAVEAWHGHTWDCMGNGIEETLDHVKGLVYNAKEFNFVSEVLK